MLFIHRSCKSSKSIHLFVSSSPSSSLTWSLLDAILELVFVDRIGVEPRMLEPQDFPYEYGMWSIEPFSPQVQLPFVSFFQENGQILKHF